MLEASATVNRVKCTISEALRGNFSVSSEAAAQRLQSANISISNKDRRTSAGTNVAFVPDSLLSAKHADKHSGRAQRQLKLYIHIFLLPSWVIVRAKELPLALSLHTPYCRHQSVVLQEPYHELTWESPHRAESARFPL